MRLQEELCHVLPLFKANRASAVCIVLAPSFRAFRIFNFEVKERISMQYYIVGAGLWGAAEPFTVDFVVFGRT